MRTTKGRSDDGADEDSAESPLMALLAEAVGRTPISGIESSVDQVIVPALPPLSLLVLSLDDRVYSCITNFYTALDNKGRDDDTQSLVPQLEGYCIKANQVIIDKSTGNFKWYDFLRLDFKAGAIYDMGL